MKAILKYDKALSIDDQRGYIVIPAGEEVEIIDKHSNSYTYFVSWVIPNTRITFEFSVRNTQLVLLEAEPTNTKD